MNIEIKDIDGIRSIIVNGEVFDWAIDEEAFETARTVIYNDPEMRANFIGDIQKHFVDCFSEFIGSKITLTEINQALIRGQI